MSKPLTRQELETIEGFAKDLKRLLSADIECDHLINAIQEVHILRKNAEYEARHIKELWRYNNKLQEMCEMAVDVMSTRIDSVSDPHALGRWADECDTAIERINAVISAKESEHPRICNHCGQEKDPV